MSKRIPKNKKLYESVKKEAKKTFKVWPSAYASGWLVKEYIRRGGAYTTKKTSRKRRSTSRKTSRKRLPVSRKRRSTKKNGLSRWFEEEWINVCKLPKIVQCGRVKSNRRAYPYCRPRYVVTSDTPLTVGEISKAELKRRCSKKRRRPSKRIM